MNRWKSTLTCSYCSKVFKDPIELPCKHNLCKEHLTEKNEDKIKCVECKQAFEINDNDFKLNTLVKKQLDEHVYLNDEDLSLKTQIEDSIRQFFQMYEEFTLTKTSLNLDVWGGFTSINWNSKNAHKFEV